MEALAIQEMVAPKPSPSKNGGTARHNKSAIPLEERTDLTIMDGGGKILGI